MMTTIGMHRVREETVNPGLDVSGFDLPGFGIPGTGNYGNSYTYYIIQITNCKTYAFRIRLWRFSTEEKL